MVQEPPPASTLEPLVAVVPEDAALVVEEVRPVEDVVDNEAPLELVVLEVVPLEVDADVTTEEDVLDVDADVTTEEDVLEVLAATLEREDDAPPVDEVDVDTCADELARPLVDDVALEPRETLALEEVETCPDMASVAAPPSPETDPLEEQPTASRAARTTVIPRPRATSRRARFVMGSLPSRGVGDALCRVRPEHLPGVTASRALGKKLSGNRRRWRSRRSGCCCRRAPRRPASSRCSRKLRFRPRCRAP
jgi:hypothetical protein